MRNNHIVNGIAGLVSVGALAIIYLSPFNGFLHSVDRDRYAMVGSVLARQALHLVKPGGQIAVISRDTEAFKNPAIDCQFDRFAKEVGKAKVPITAVRRLQVDPLRVVEVPDGDFVDLIKSTPEGDVIVSFMGPPLLSDAQVRQLPESRAAIVALCSGSLPAAVDLRSLFEQKLLAAAVVSRPVNNQSASPQKDPRTWFDQSFVEVTTDNLAALPASTPEAKK